MAESVPLPVRLAVGLVVTGIYHLRRLPSELPALSVELTGRAVRTSLRIQQELTTLASRGEQALAELFEQPVDRPEWAQFDDEEPASQPETAALPAAADETAPTETGDALPVPDYDGLRLTELRVRLPGLGAAEVGRLLAYEQAGRQRAGFVTLLQNRRETLEHDSGTNPGRQP